VSADQCAISALAFGDHHEARSVLVEPVDDAGAAYTTDFGNARSMMEQSVHQRPRRNSGAWMDHQPGRLVDDHHPDVLVHHVEREVLGLERNA